MTLSDVAKFEELFSSTIHRLHWNLPGLVTPTLDLNLNADMKDMKTEMGTDSGIALHP